MQRVFTKLFTNFCTKPAAQSRVTAFIYAKWLNLNSILGSEPFYNRFAWGLMPGFTPFCGLDSGLIKPNRRLNLGVFAALSTSFAEIRVLLATKYDSNRSLDAFEVPLAGFDQLQALGERKSGFRRLRHQPFILGSC